MANNQNLKPIRSVSEAREKGKKGGIKSGEIRKARKSLKEELLLLLEENDFQDKLCLSLIDKAINGDTRAFITIRDTIGEKPIDKTEITEARTSIPTFYLCEKDCTDLAQTIELIKQANHKEVVFISSEEEEMYERHLCEMIGTEYSAENRLFGSFKPGFQFDK